MWGKSGILEMENTEIAEVFLDIAELLKLKKDNIFKIRSYQKAARSIGELSVAVAQLITEGRLKEIPGVGSSNHQKNCRAGDHRAPRVLPKAEGGVPGEPPFRLGLERKW